MKMSICIVLLGFFVTLAVGSAALAEPGSLTYKKHYDVNGVILMKIQAGSDYDHTGQHKSLVQGVGQLQRDDYIVLSKAGIIVETDNSWTADPESFRGLEVAGTFRLHDQYEGQEADAENAKNSVPASETTQMFAVSVDAEPGETGNLSQNVSAASSVYGNDDYMFAVDQSVSTSDGTVKRYIDITDPASGAYLFEDAEIKGEVYITEELSSTGNDGEFSLLDDSALEENDKGHDQKHDDGNEGIANDSDSISTEGEDVLVIDGAEIFKSVVPLGTQIDELGLDEEIVFQSDLITINDIYVKWDDQLFGEYDPDQEGSYTFAGELVFPDTVANDDKVLIFHVVHVVEDVEAFQLEQLENPVHGGENGEDQDTDKESDR